MQIWDTAGQEKYHSLGIGFYKGSESCALVFDITNTKSFETVTNWREEFLIQANPPNPNAFPFVLIGNKVDKEAERKVTTNRAQQWCKMNGDIPYFEASAKDNLNVKELFEQLARDGLKNSKTSEGISEPSGVAHIRISDKEKAKTGCSC